MTIALHFHPVQEAHAEQRDGHVGLMDQRIDVVQRDIADPDRIELNLAYYRLAIGCVGQRLLAAVEINANPARISRSQRNHRRAGIDQKAHGSPVDRAGRQKMPLAVGNHDNLAGTVATDGANGMLANAQGALLATDFDHGLIPLNGDQPDAIDRLTNRYGQWLAPVDHQHRLAAQNAGQPDLLRTSLIRDQDQRQGNERKMTFHFFDPPCAMKPVAIFRHTPSEGPGYFAIFLEEHGIPWRLIAVDAGEAVPESPEDYAGLCFMGGPMSVNDPLPWIDATCQLIRQADAANIPLIGHCLGGQLISKALGGQITPNPVKEIGWGTVYAESDPLAQHWLGAFAGRVGTVFHWHGETFSLPEGASRLVSSPHCANQMFARGPHLAMQCHVEMTPEMITTWSTQWADEVAAVADQSSVQSPEAMQEQTPQHLGAMRQLASQLYSVWIQGLAR